MLDSRSRFLYYKCIRINTHFANVWLGENHNLRFESLVNSVRCKTLPLSGSVYASFESLVNSVGCRAVSAFVLQFYENIRMKTTKNLLLTKPMLICIIV